MKIHHLNCGSMCPPGGKFFPRVFAPEIVCHCLLIEDQKRLILVDTGLGTRDIKDHSRVGWIGKSLGPVFDPRQTAFAQVKALGYSPQDVTDVIPTHLDFDHAGGIQDFPRARVHIAKKELSASRSKTNLAFRQRYRKSQLSGKIQWQEFTLDKGESWNGLEVVREIAGLPPEILLVNLPGHTPGHFGIAVDTGKKWLLHAGDAYYDHRELIEGSKSAPGLSVFQKLVHTDYSLAKRTQARLTELNQNKSIDVFCSHDPLEFRRALSQK